MKIFLKNIITYLVFIYVLGNTIIYLIIFFFPGRALASATEYKIWQFQKDAANAYKNQTKNVILGDSRSLADINPRVLRHNFINLSIGGTTTFEGFLTFKSFLKNNKIDTLIISYGAYHFVESDVFNERTIPFQFASIEDINALEKIESRFGITIDNKKPNTFLSLQRKCEFYHVPVFFRSTFFENLIQRNANDTVIKNLKMNLGHTLFGIEDSCSRPNREVAIAFEKNSFNENPVIRSYLDSIYNLSIKNNIKIILVITPFNYSSYLQLKNTDFYSGYIDYLRSLKLAFPKMTVYDKFLFLADSYFGDDSHLNLKGCNFFSEEIKSELFSKK